MRIGIDARWLSKPHPSGIGVYLIEVLTRLNRLEDGNEYFLFSNKPFIDSVAWRSNFHKVYIPGRIGSLWILRELKKELPGYHLDVFWGPEHVLPGGLKGVRKVVTIHDIALMLHPSWGKLYNALIQNTLVRRSIRKADVILADSKSTKKDLITKLKVKPEKIRGVYPGKNELAIYTEDEEQDVLSRMGINGQSFLLYVGTLEPRKNIVSIVQAFDLLKQDSAYAQYKLVLAGGLGWKVEKILNAIEESPCRQDIIRPGYISDVEKSILLHNAEAFLFPSFYEGFGIPVLEAISAGIPVITARNSSLPEVAGPWESYVDRADDVEEICSLIRELLALNGEERQKRNAASQKYTERFDWSRCAGQIESIMNRRKEEAERRLNKQ